MTVTDRPGNFLEVYHNSIDRSNFNMDEGKYVKGSYVSKKIPTLKGEKYIEAGDIRIEISSQSPDSNIVRFYVSKHDEDGNTVDSITALITQDVAREIGNQLSTTLFDPDYDLGLKFTT